MTEAQETEALWREYRARPSEELHRRLIVAYAPLVQHLAIRFNSRLWVPEDVDDLVCYGLIGLLDAMRRFDPNRDGRFLPFAVAHIRYAMERRP